MQDWIILAGMLVLLLALVYWKNVANTKQEKKDAKLQPIEVDAKLEYFSDGWRATFFKDGVLCYGVFINLSEGQGRKDAVLPAIIEKEPTADNELYLLRA